MKKLFSNTAVSLLELIIASVLVVVMVLGIFAVNTVLNNNNSDIGQKYFVKSSTQSTINHILNNATLAIGSGTMVTGGSGIVPDQGIFLGGDSALGWGNANSFCIHQDIAPPPPVTGYVSPVTIDYAPVNTTPSSPPYYSNSRWLCYTYFPVGSANPYQIYYCAYTYNLSAPYRGAQDCVAGNARYLGSAYSMTPNFTFGIIDISSAVANNLPLSNSDLNFLLTYLDSKNYIVSHNPGLFTAYGVITSTFLNSTQNKVTTDLQNSGNLNVSKYASQIYAIMLNSSKLQFTITLNNCLNNAATGSESCTSAASSEDQVNNPEVELTGSVVPTQEGVLQE
jgi:hypothetical protein